MGICINPARNVTLWHVKIWLALLLKASCIGSVDAAHRRYYTGYMITKLITITHSNMYVHIIKVYQTAYHICNPVTLVHKPGCLHYGILGGDSSNTLSTKAFLLLVVLAKGCRVSAQVSSRGS